MTPVNSELMSEADPTVLLRVGDPGFAAGVAKLFGTSHPNVRRAVEEFLGKNPASFDHHRLRVIAATAGVFEDKNHVAQMIRQLPPTGLEIAAKPIDLTTAREQFEISLPRQYRQETRRALVLDLVHETTLEVLENCPPERVPERGREIVRKSLLKKLGGTADDQNAALHSGFVDEVIVTAALDRIETKVERAEQSHPDGSEPLSGDELRHVFGCLVWRDIGLKIPDRHLLLERAWKLYERCSPSYVALSRALADPMIFDAAGSSILDAIRSWELANPDKLLGAKHLRGLPLGVSSLPEEAARELVRAGADVTVPLRPDKDRTKRALLRRTHYLRTRELLPPASTQDLDRAVLVTPPQHLTLDIVRAVEPETLGALISRSHLMNESAFGALLDHPGLTLEQLSQMVEVNWSLLTSNDFDIAPRAASLCAHRLMTDELLADMIVGLRMSDRAPSYFVLDQMLDLAVCNRGGGERVQVLLERRCRDLSETERMTLLGRLAENTASAHMQTTFAELAEKTYDIRLAARLLSNGTIRKQTWEDLHRHFPTVVADEVRTYSSEPVTCPPSFRPVDVAEIVLSGEAAPGRARAVVSDVFMFRDLSPTVNRLLDEGLIPEDDLLVLTSDVDRHVALRVATHSRTCSLEAKSELALSAERRLRETAHVVALATEHGLAVMPPDRRLNSWDKLPNRNDEPFELTPLHRLIDRQVVDGLTVTVPRTRRELIDLSKEMHNCLEGYVDDVAAHRQIIVVARAEGDVFAAAISVDEHLEEGIVPLGVV